MRHFLLVLIAAILPAAAAVTLVEDSPLRLSFIVESSAPGFSPAGAGFEPIFDEQSGTLAGPGGVLLPLRSVFIALPPAGEARVSVVAEDVQSLLCPGDLAIDTSRAPSSASWLVETQEQYMRQLRVLRLVLCPMRPEGPRTIGLATRLRVTVDYPAARRNGGPAAIPPGAYWQTCSHQVLNLATGLSWYAQGGLARSAAVTRRNTVLSPAAGLIRFEIGDGIGGFNETTTREKGVLRIVPDDIYRLLSQSGVAMNDIALYASARGELDSIVPKYDAIPRNLVPVPLLKQDNNNNRKFDEGDQILACVGGINDWVSSTSRPDSLVYSFNRYAKSRVYWLSLSGSAAAVDTFAAPTAPAHDTAVFFSDRARFAQAKDIPLSGGTASKGDRNWIWLRMGSSNTSFRTSLDLPGLDTSRGGFMRVRAAASSLCSYRLGRDSTVGNATSAAIRHWGDTAFSVSYVGINSNAFEIHWLELWYPHRLTMKNTPVLRIFSDTLPRIYIPGQIGGGYVADTALTLIRYSLKDLPASDTTWLFRLSPGDTQVALVGRYLGSTSCSWVDTLGRGFQYLASKSSALQSLPDNAERIVSAGATYTSKRVLDILDPANKADLLIIAASAFLPQAEDLADHKAALAARNTHALVRRPAVVNLDDIYREFSGGLADPSAIRNFLVSVMDTAAGRGWSGKPDFVLLFGGGHYDYKNYSSSKPVYLPTYEQNSICKESYYSLLQPGTHLPTTTIMPSVALGRINSFTDFDADNAVAKIKGHEGPAADMGPWRNRFLFVADDDRQGRDAVDLIVHIIDSDTLGVIMRRTRPAAEIRKVTLFEYTRNDALQKPGATAALLSELNNGVSVVNWIGHGSENAWADEGVFMSDKIQMLDNALKYPLVCAFSCSVGYFDQPDPGAYCLSDKMVLSADRGGIAAISSTREAYANKNVKLAKTFFYVLGRNSDAAFGQSYLESAMSTYNSGTDVLSDSPSYIDNYCYLGDPSVQAAPLVDTVSVHVRSLAGREIDTLKGLQTVVFSGNISGTALAAAEYNTKAGDSTGLVIALFSPDLDSVLRKDKLSISPAYTGKNYFPGGQVFYSLPGAAIFATAVPLRNGSFTDTVRLPRNLPFDKKGVRLQLYAWSTRFSGVPSSIQSRRCAEGSKGNIIFHGSESSAGINTVGPVITIQPAAGTSDSIPVFSGAVDTIILNLPADLSVDVYDEDGLDGRNGPDEGVSVEIPGILPRQNVLLTAVNSTRGRATISLDRAAAVPGNYLVKVSAQDLFGNVTQRSVILKVCAEDDVQLGRVYNYPNPVRIGAATRFFFQKSSTASTVRASIYVYTLSGRPVWSCTDAENGKSWDLHDMSGNTLPPNVYLYRVLLHSQDQSVAGQDRIMKSPVRKLVILPPR